MKMFLPASLTWPKLRLSRDQSRQGSHQNRWVSGIETSSAAWDFVGAPTKAWKVESRGGKQKAACCFKSKRPLIGLVMSWEMTIMLAQATENSSGLSFLARRGIKL